MKEIGIALVFGHMLAVAGCRTSTFIADERRDDTETTSDMPTDFQTDSDTAMDSQTGSPTDSDTVTDSSTDSDTHEDSDSSPLDCEGLSATPADIDRTVQVDGRDRSYVLHIPDTYTGTTPAPLIIEYHAIGGTGRMQLSISSYPSVTDSDGVVMAFPNGWEGPSGTAWSIGPCCTNKEDNIDDVAFTAAIITDIKTIACIDPSRIYATGLYIGGGMAYHLACQSADTFAAVVSSAFDLNDTTVDACLPQRPMTVVAFRATEDNIIPYEGGLTYFVPGQPVTFLGAENTFDRWAALNGCTGVPTDAGEGCQLYGTSQCEAGVEVMLCTEQGAVSFYDDAAIAWPVLQNHSLP